MKCVFLTSLNQRFDSVVQFVQDSAVSVRHNSLLDNFFHANHFIKSVAEEQLICSFDLFPRNLTEEGPCGGSLPVQQQNDCIQTSITL